MSLKAGDEVYCQYPTGDLEHDKIYIISKVIDNGRGKETTVTIRGSTVPYLSYRFINKELKNLGRAEEIKFFSAPLGDWPVTPGYLESLARTLDVPPPLPASESKASKNDTEKIDLSLIPQIALIECAKAFMVGEKKYGRYNYCKGHDASQLIGAMLRHATAYFNGEEHDPVDKQHHLGSVMACCAMLLRQQELGTLKDNRYKKCES